MYKHVAKLIYTHTEREREERERESEREGRVKSDKIYKLLRNKLIGIGVHSN